MTTFPSQPVSPFVATLVQVIDTKKSITIVGSRAEHLIRQIRATIGTDIDQLRKKG